MATTTKDRYIEAIGRRKTATARVRLTPAKETTITVNNREMVEYFKHAGHQQSVTAVLATPDAGIEHYHITAKVLVSLEAMFELLKVCAVGHVASLGERHERLLCLT